jgi:hypothetical protein
MKLTHFILAVPLLTLVACGSDMGIYALSTGTYGLSGTSAVAPDDCNLGASNAIHDGLTIQITVSGSNATFDFGSGDPTHNPVAAILGNTIGSGAKTYDFDNNTWPPPQRFDCIETITLTMSGGTLLANDQLQGSLLKSSVRNSGSACTAQQLGYKAFPGSSTLSFTAKKQ